MSDGYVTDTMSLVLRLEQRRLPQMAKTLFEDAEAGKIVIYVPAIVLAEILYLSEKRRIGLSLSEVEDYLQQLPNLREQPLNWAVVRSSEEISDIPELHDRLIAGTARFLDKALITNDPVIRASSFVKTVW